MAKKASLRASNTNIFNNKKKIEKIEGKKMEDSDIMGDWDKTMIDNNTTMGDINKKA